MGVLSFFLHPHLAMSCDSGTDIHVLWKDPPLGGLFVILRKSGEYEAKCPRTHTQNTHTQHPHVPVKKTMETAQAHLMLHLLLGKRSDLCTAHAATSKTIRSPTPPKSF